MGAVIERLALGHRAAVYELSSRGALLRWLRRRFADVVVSEFFDDVPRGAFRDGVQCQDVQRLTYPDDSFDVVTSTEVFEHVPDDHRAFREIHRVLRPGGVLVFTVPLSSSPRTLERAECRDGVIVHLVEPEYHSDRLRGRRAVLAFRTYGTDIVARLGVAGFEAHIETLNDAAHGIAGAPVIIAHRSS
jgi:SAM-dependent methyltransferase